MPLAGVIWSSWPSRVKRAWRRSTVTESTSSCWRSRSKRDRSCVALAVMTASALEPVGRRVIRERQVVVLGVVAAVALEREVRVTEARIARLVVGAAVAVAPERRVKDACAALSAPRRARRRGRPDPRPRLFATPTPTPSARGRPVPRPPGTTAPAAAANRSARVRAMLTSWYDNGPPEVYRPILMLMRDECVKCFNTDRQRSAGPGTGPHAPRVWTASRQNAPRLVARQRLTSVSGTRICRCGRSSPDRLFVTR